MKHSIWTLAALSLSAFVGCATPRSWAQLDLQHMKGEMTYEQATTKLGPPSRCYDDAATRVCDWAFDHSGGLITAMPGRRSLQLSASAVLAAAT